MLSVKDILKTKVVINVLSFVAFLYVKFVYLFSKIEYRGVEKVQDYIKDDKSVILVFWHSRSILMAKFWCDKIGVKKHPIYGIFSTHRDGTMIGKIFSYLGVKNIMASSKSIMQARQVAMKSMRLLKSGTSIGFTPDGPVGPRMHFVSNSALLFAKASGAPIIPVYISSHKPKILNTWDRFLIIKPFHKSIIEVDDLFFIDKKMTAKDLKNFEKKLVDRMVKKTLALDKEMGMPEILQGSVNNAKHKRKKI